MMHAFRKFWQITTFLLFAVGSYLQAEEASEKKRLLVLVIASDNHPIYIELQKVWRSYMNAHPEVTAYFLKGDPTLSQTNQIAGDTLYVNSPDGYVPGIFLKSIVAFEALSSELDNYDYLLRTNLSSVFDFPALLAALNKMPSTQCYAGRNGVHHVQWVPKYYQTPFVEGSGILMSMDLVKLLLKEKSSALQDASLAPDDVLIGKIFQDNGIKIIPFSHLSFSSREEWPKDKLLLKKAFHYRIRSYRNGPPGMGGLNYGYRNILCPCEDELFIATELVKEIYPHLPAPTVDPNPYPLHTSLSTLFQYYKAFPSPINEHLQTLRELGRASDHITEIGSQSMLATFGLLQGLSERENKGTYIGRFFEAPPLHDLLLANKSADEAKISFSYSHGSDRTFEIEPTDLLFIDGKHTSVHVGYALRQFAPHTKKYIAIHHTAAPWGLRDNPNDRKDLSLYFDEADRSKSGSMPAIVNFLKEHPEWHLAHRFSNNHGLVVLERNGTDPIDLSAAKNDDRLVIENQEDKTDSKIIYFIQGHWGNFFDPASRLPMKQAGYDLTPMYELYETAKKLGYDLRIASRDAHQLSDISGAPIEPFKAIFVFDIFLNQLNYLQYYPKEKLFAILWEPPSVIPESYDKKNHNIFQRVYTWRDADVDNVKYFKLHYPVLHPPALNIPDFENKKFCAMIASNRYSPHPRELYSERKNLAHYFQTYHPSDLDLYGRGWQKGFDKVYRGIVDDKIELLKNYKFNIAYENIKDESGYVTEKIFDAFEAGCIPVYWGASNIADYVPRECFIERDAFVDNDALYAYLQSISKEQYESMQASIRAFLRSEEAKQFSASRFVDTIMEAIERPLEPASHREEVSRIHFSAAYGAADVYDDVTRLVVANFFQKDRFVIPASVSFNSLFNDVAPGLPKTLILNIEDKEVVIPEKRDKDLVLKLSM